MASTIFFVNSKGDEVVSRHYRTDVTKSSIDSFRSKIVATKSTGSTSPVILVEGASFMYVRHRNLFLVGATRNNINAALAFEYLLQVIRVLKAYLGDDFTDDSLRGNFTLVYELFDEMMDNGFPQNCSTDVLKMYINQGESRGPAAATGTALTSQITGAIDWRREGIRYRNNEVFIDVQETVTLQMSSTGQVLRSEILGRVMMKALLSGMPECKFGLNDKLIMEKEGNSNSTNAAGGVELDDCSFHRCVRLGKFETDRTITFIPPDGEFELMRYRVASASQPFRLLPNIVEVNKLTLTVNLKISADFPEDKKAVGVIVRIPMPPTAASATFQSGKGRAKYEPGQRALVWRIGGFQGQTEYNLDAVVTLLPSTREKQWTRPPISVDFQIPMWSASGVQVRFLKVYEKNSYQHNKWVKYLTKAGEYQVKI
jgi:AP-2 complex subunit mu-1